MTLGIGANMACGLWANHGSMAGAISSWQRLQNGVTAALMAKEGLTANPNMVEAKNGFFDTLRARARATTTRSAWRRVWADLSIYESPGIGLKKYPSCYHTHCALDGCFLCSQSIEIKTMAVLKSRFFSRAGHPRAVRFGARKRLFTPVRRAFMPGRRRSGCAGCRLTLFWLTNGDES